LLAELGPVIRLTREAKPSHLGITYMGRLDDASPQPVLSSEILEARWYSAGELPRRLRPETQLAVDAAVRQLPQWRTEHYTHV
jgi:hypothetical protein